MVGKTGLTQSLEQLFVGCAGPGYCKVAAQRVTK